LKCIIAKEWWWQKRAWNDKNIVGCDLIIVLDMSYLPCQFFATIDADFCYKGHLKQIQIKYVISKVISPIVVVTDEAKEKVRSI